MEIITATKEQLPIIRDLAYKIWPDTYGQILSSEQLEYMLLNFYNIPSLEEQFDNGQVFLLVKEEENFLGFAAYQINCKTEGKTKLHKIYVLPETQGKGIGKLLLQEVENRARLHGNTHLFLNVNKYNKAQEFYKSQGFVVVLEEVIDIGHGYIMDDYVMEKEL
ncbi:GNAT family N-acetyltransferase [Flavobacterium luminosum]|uniref:GNAT family N-acetyltransferase n=1 Tax=Flavobacterium luminosum TaxID=2949086 RepID=A0ABT0TK59_9FLAO|nr:GNAT family N-acetyltransferase [Flavobacterium sp. HXWNR70]MCL9807851.1 GNAT family N-acetyltransferase [Flavobacterium sp. HXWNR70]